MSASDGVLALSYHNNLHLYHADPSNLGVIGDIQTPSTYCITPAIGKGVLINRTGGGLECWSIVK